MADTEVSILVPLPLVGQSWSEGPLGQVTAVLFAGPTVAALGAWLFPRANQLRRLKSKEVTQP